MFAYYFLSNHGTNTNVVNNNLTEKKAEMKGDRVLPQVDVDKLVGDIKNDYKNSPKFKECIGMDMGIQSCLRDAVMDRVEKEDNPKYCEDLVDGVESCKENYYTKKAVKDLSPVVCDNLKNKNNCLEAVYTKKAENAGDESICSNLEDQNSKQNCLRNVVRKIAVKTQNPKLCDKLVIKRVDGEGENKIEYTDKMDADMCKEEVKMEIEMNKEEEKRQEEMKAEAEKMKTESAEAGV